MSELVPGRLLATGFSGPIGAALSSALQGEGWNITRLVHGAPRRPGQVQWDPEQALSPEAVSGYDAVIHLAGESIMGRWTPAKKARIRNSRVRGTQNLANALARAAQKPRILIAGSASGYYGDRGDEILDEGSSSGSGFLPEVCREWEAACQPAIDAGIRTIHTRTGVVLSPKGGALGQMLTPFKIGIGGKLGSGRQWWSWIHVQDLANAVLLFLREQALQGPVNMVAPQPVTNVEFTKVLASVLHRPAVFPVPAFVLKIVFGQMAEEAVLASQRIEPARLQASGFEFQYPELRTALNALISQDD
jgi:uncharacterized protein (TIGR01777 family)